MEGSDEATASIATATAESSTATEAAIMPASASLTPRALLREWSSNTSSDPPPVAPAVVLNETSDGSAQQQSRPSASPIYSYPVATFVSNFVRQGVIEIRDHLGSHSLPGEEEALSIRSDAPLLAPTTTAAAATATAPGFPTIRDANLNICDDESAEFVLIDGDLVSIPPPPPNSREQEEIDLQHELQRSQCKAHKMRKNVKGLRKWIKKKKMIGRRAFRQQVEECREELHRQFSSTNDEDETSAAYSGSQLSGGRCDGESIAASSLTTANDSLSGPTSPSKKERKKKKRQKTRKRAWLKDIEGRVRGGSSSSSPTAAAAAAASSSPSEAVQFETSLLAEPPPPLRPSPPTVADFVQAEPPLTPGLITLDVPPLPLPRTGSIAAEASFVGNADQQGFLEAGVLPDSVIPAEAYIEDRLDDYDKYDKKDDGYPYLRSVVPRDADFKVDKLDAPCVDSWLRRAGEFAQDLEGSIQDSLVAPPKIVKGKSDGASVPLSNATSNDPLVHNDILKLIMVACPKVDKSALARSLRKSQKKSRKRTILGVDVHSWMPPNEDDVKFTIWDVQGANETNQNSYSANFGAHPGTQSLFFSDRSLYLLVWDLAANNSKTYQREVSAGDDSSDEEEDDEEYENEYLREEANRQADRALQTDIEDRVLSWVDCVARRGSHSAILPIALVPTNMSPKEAKRRCDVMQALLMEHTEKKLAGGTVPPKVLSGAETVICLSLDTNMGMDLLEETILAIATDKSHSVFDHVGTPVPKGTTDVLETVRRLKQDHKLVLVDHLMAELSDSVALSVEDVLGALHFLASIGEVLYFGGTDDVLSQYVILSKKWLVSALSCILRNDLKRELYETRRFMNMQCLYSDQQFPENHVVQTFSANNSSCPLLSSSDTQMLWQSMSFMREAADRSAQLSENSTTAFNMFGFLEHLLVHTGVFCPLDIDRFASPDNVYFVPSLLAPADSRDVWTFKSSESWMTTLSHSWLFRDGTPVGLMEHVTVALLRDLYEFSHIVAKPQHLSPARARTFPFAQNSLTNFIDTHDGEAIGHIKIHQMMCWKSSVLIKIGCVFPEGQELRESFVEIFIAITDQSSPHCVASDAMRSNMQRLTVSGKGQVGHHGRKLWKGGYGIVLDSIKASVAHCTNVDRQVVCPECLAHAHPSTASTWSWDSVRAAATGGSPVVRCMRGHRVDSNLIGGTRPALPKAEGGSHTNLLPKKKVPDLLPSVVVVGLWDPTTKSIRNVGSGFVVDKKHGLIITAGHILFDMGEGANFGTPYFGLKEAKAVIGVIPEKGNAAVFRYFADVVADDIHNVDACVLKITTKMEKDVDDDALVGEQSENVVKDIQKEQLSALKMIKHFELEETVRILGFNQGGEGLLKPGEHVNRSADFAKGYICKQFKLTDDDHSSSSSMDSSSSGSGFAPREEIVVICPSIVGHSGGPCVNDEGKVVGILSRADPVDRQRCYLVPSSELKALLKKAKSSSKAGRLKMF